MVLRHCQRSEAIQAASAEGSLDCFATLAMTGERAELYTARPVRHAV
jgi:hypothetical protein